MAGTKTIIGLGGLEGLEEAEKAAIEEAKKEADKARQAREGQTPPSDSATPRPDRVALYSGPTVVDDDKVAEGLKKLRSLDESLGPLTGVTQAVTDASSSEKTRVAEPGERSSRSGTLGGAVKVPPFSNQATLPGLPVAPPVGTPAAPPPPSSANPLIKTMGGLPSSFTTRPTQLPGVGPPRGAPQAPLPRDPSDAMDSLDIAQRGPRLPRPTAVGRSASAPAGDDPLVPLPSDDRAYKGTLHGHDIHLPDLPEVMRDDSGATVLADPSPITAGQIPTAMPETDFSLSNRGFFESDAIDDDDDAAPAKRSSVALRIGVFVAVVTVFVVAAVAWVRVHKPEVTEGKVPAPAAGETPAANELPAAETPPSAAPTETPPVPAPAAVEAAPRPPGAAAVPESPVVVDRPPHVKRTSHLEKPSHAAGKTSEHYGVGARRPSGTVEPAPRTSHAAGAPAPSTKPRGKRGPQDEEDPDGTLPLSPNE